MTTGQFSIWLVAIFAPLLLGVALCTGELLRSNDIRHRENAMATLGLLLWVIGWTSLMAYQYAKDYFSARSTQIVSLVLFEERHFHGALHRAISALADHSKVEHAGADLLAVEFDASGGSVHMFAVNLDPRCLLAAEGHVFCTECVFHPAQDTESIASGLRRAA